MTKINQKHIIHTILGHSYMLFFVFLCIGIILDNIFPFFVIKNITLQYIGIFFVLLGTVLSFWAQSSSHKSSHARLTNEERSPHMFEYGPYRFTCCPTQIALFLLIFGLGFATSLLWVSISAVCGLFCNYYFFVKKQSSILKKRYGESYEAYRSKVRF